jgi:ClpX C4-type zinc finger/Glyoxalase superfamily protein
MRDFRDAKAMAHALREALKAKSIETTHGESLELIAKAFGCTDWNVLSARIAAAETRGPLAPVQAPAKPNDAIEGAVHCSFCFQSQYDVRTVIAGPEPTYICDQCVTICNDVLDAEDDRPFFDLLAADRASGDQAYPAAMDYLTGKFTEDIVSLVERSRRGAQLYRTALDAVRSVLAARADDSQASADLLASSRFNWLKGKTPPELLAERQRLERGLERSEQALRIAMTVLNGRRQ